ncbi:zinc ribbon domain-containing protein [Paenibacillus dakarensis]|uniref:zinc ribbon domain-containing protein n=1 Tax=Paenibacillus dakarensis TaxID=1527293 RepID=UPI0006D567FA|nr:zinc ribbon domain-containing protein [Paenibacillus dakarensis]
MNFLQKIKDGANKATEKAQHVVEINKLNGQISDIEQRKYSYYMEMGRAFYEGYRSQDMSIAEKEMMDLAKSCDDLQEQIDELRNRIAILKNERICKCGRTVALDANFCPYCGNKLADLTVKQEQWNEPMEPVEPKEPKEPKYERELFFSEESVATEVDEGPYVYKPEYEHHEAEAEAEVEELPVYKAEDEEGRRYEEEQREKERRHLEELERERERQLELDRRIRFWQENNQSQDNLPKNGEVRDMVKCQICSADLPKGSKWCPRCGAEQI